MEHRVGIALSYPRNCRSGITRIFHLEPATDGPDPRRATTVELERTGQSPDWKIRQHRGYRNRPPTPDEQQAANELLKIWHEACRGTT